MKVLVMNCGSSSLKYQLIDMENEYQQFANQYSEMRMQISNDSIIAQLTAEQEKTEQYP